MEKAVEKLLRIAGIEYRDVKNRFDDSAWKNIEILEELLEVVEDDDRPF
ncbi:MAG: hypothetical protein QXF45_00490 [Candidatus Caldarchaeum sp.]